MVTQKRIIAVSLGLWIIAFLLASILMPLMGIHLENSSEKWNIHHPKYWQFEGIMIPLFLLLAGGVFYLWYRKEKESLCSETQAPWLIGLEVMGIQFLLDALVLAWLFGNGISYFFGVVTLLYLTLPLISYFVATLTCSSSSG